MADEHRQANKLLREERVKRGWSQKYVADKIHTSRDMISRWESGEHETSLQYQRALCELFGLNAIELGFLPNLTVPQEMAQSTQTQSNDPTNVTISLTMQAVSQGVMLSVQGREIVIQSSKISPQKLINDVSGAVSGAVDGSSNSFYHQDMLERLARVFNKALFVDDITVNYLETRTNQYWQDRHKALLPSSELVHYVIEHLQKTTALLEQPTLPGIRNRLCTIASQVAQLAGHLLFDMNEYIHARSFHTIAITAAQEANDFGLEATAWGRLSFSWLYDNKTQEAIFCIQHARQLVAGKNALTVQAYLTAIEAQIQATIGEREQCLNMLNDAERISSNLEHEEPNHWLYFDYSRLAGYRGSCFRRLYSASDPATFVFLTDAQQTLHDALNHLPSSLLQRRPALLVNLACTYAQQGEMEEACDYALQAVTIMRQLKSKATMKRLAHLRRQLTQWEHTTHVKNLDQHIESLYI